YFRSRKPGRGDIVAVKNPTQKASYFLSRVIGLPKERLEVRNDRIFIAGIELKLRKVKAEECGLHSEDDSRLRCYEEDLRGFTHFVLLNRDVDTQVSENVDLPPDVYWVATDNRNYMLGPKDYQRIPLSRIVGKMISQPGGRESST